MATPRPRFPVPLWSWAYVTFRFADGATHALVPLAVVLHYELPLWALALTAASMNLASVPASFLWGTVMDRVRDRRSVAVAGFAFAATGMALLATLPPFPFFVLGAILFTFFGVATSPAASTLILQGVDRPRWSLATSSLSRRTGLAFLTGMTMTIILGLTGTIDFRAVFVAGAIVTLLAALIAGRTIPEFPSPVAKEADYDPRVVQAGQRWFDRIVYFPSRLRNLPNLSQLVAAIKDPHRLWPLGYALTFMGSVSFFSSYAGVLADHLVLPAGLILLAQSPSHVVTPITYPWAARHGARLGESRGVAKGAAIRLVALPLLCLVMVFGSRDWLPLLLVLHAFMGLSFALIQVNGPVLLAEMHPGGRGQGVGSYHAAIGLGTLFGSLVAFGLLRAFPFQYSYLFSVGVGTLGCLLLFTAHRRHIREKPSAVHPAHPHAPPPAAAVELATPGPDEA